MSYANQSDQRLSLYLRLRDEFAARIASGQWRPGESIPTEAELVAQFSASIGTVRKAIDLLVAEELLERFQGKGTYVRRAKFDASLFRFFRFQNDAGERRIPEGRIVHRHVLTAPSAVAAAHLQCHA